VHETAGQPRTAAVSVRPFVGRTRELNGLEAALGEAADGHGSLQLVTGEPGIGKTRLMSELAQLARERGIRAVAGRCWEEGGAPPYWPWIQVVRALGGDLEQLAGGGLRSEAARAVVPGGDRIRLFDAVARFLADETLLVTLDDVHAGDEPSLLLLRYLGDALAQSHVLLVASYRETEPRVRDLGEAFAELARVGRRVPLRGLSTTDIGAYLETVTGARPAPGVVARLHEITGGNPFFAGEIVRLVSAEQALDDTIKDPFLRIPEEVRTLIRRRVAHLSTEAVATLRIAAVIGREFDLPLLERTSRLSPARLLDVLGEAVAVGVVTEASRHRYAFAHELVRETLYDDLPPARRVALHRDVGHLLEAAYADDLDPHRSEIARHLYLGDGDRALEHLILAGERAARLFAYEEAVVHYRRALEVLPGPERRGELLLRLGDAQWRSGDGAQARVTFEEAIDAGRRLGDGELLARAALGYVTALGGFLLYARFEVGGTGVALLEEALAALPPTDSALRAHVLAHLALEMWSANEPVDRRTQISHAAIEMARRLDDGEALVTALHARHWVLTTPGMALERLAHTEEMLRAAADPEIEFLAHNARFHCFLELCDRRGMDAESRAMTELAEQLRQPFNRWHTVCLRALRATLDGRFDEAERLAQEALEVGRGRQSEYATYVFRYAQLLAIRWAQGRVDELWPEIQDHAERYPWIPRWRDALVAATLGDVQMARRELELHAADGFAGLPRDGLWLLHACALAEACVVAADRERAVRLYELLLPHADDNAISYTLQPFGPVALRLAKLAALLGRWPDADRFFVSALARSELLGAPAIRARVLREHATALAARGEPADRTRGEAMLAEAARLSEQLGIASAPSAQEAIFTRDGDVWTLSYVGRTFRLPDVKGLGYIAALLACPGRELHALELTSPAANHRGPDVPLLDAQAKAAYAQRLAELEDELDQARAWGDGERVAGLQHELDALGAELAHAVGLRGADRTFASPAERARISVTKAIRTAIRQIARHSPELAEHLEASLHTGRFCSYAPPGAVPPRWSL
jgi:tetratricopeptide (TPR) repeat protein